MKCIFNGDTQVEMLRSVISYINLFGSFDFDSLKI